MAYLCISVIVLLLFVIIATLSLFHMYYCNYRAWYAALIFLICLILMEDCLLCLCMCVKILSFCVLLVVGFTNRFISCAIFVSLCFAAFFSDYGILATSVQFLKAVFVSDNGSE